MIKIWNFIKTNITIFLLISLSLVAIYVLEINAKIYINQRIQPYAAMQGEDVYWYFNNENFVFSSEIKVIYEFCNKKNEIRAQSVYDYYLMGYIASPQTIYEDIYSLTSGHCLKYSVFNKTIDIFSGENIKRANIFSRLLKSFNYLVWGDV